MPPKDDPKRLACLFTGRREELDRVILPLLDGRNVLVRGMWGVGKTTFILQTRHELSYQAGRLKVRQLLYIAQKHGGFSQDNRKALDELGWGDFVEVLPLLDYLVQRDLMIRQDYTGGMRFMVSARAAKAAELPPPSL